MARYEQMGEFYYDELSEETKYRFAELEINRAYRVFHSVIFQFDPERIHKAFNHLYTLLYFLPERSPELEEEWYRTLSSHRFKFPTKEETINYFLYHKQTYSTIRKIMGASPNTIAKYRFQMLPEYVPVFKYWNPTVLAKWEGIKKGLNVWEQPLAHTEKDEI